MSELAPIEGWNAIASAGGPLILLPRAALPFWTGVAGDDYDRACGVDGRLGTLDVGDDQALVIGDEPDSTALLPGTGADSLVVAKWTYGPDKAGVVAALRKVRLEAFPEPEVAFVFGSSPQVLFDSALPGGDVRECLTAALQAGNYVASTLLFKPAHDICLVLHWVRPAGMTPSA
jgi:hypothetical protein